MQKMRLNHVLAQRLSPQQIQTIKLLQVPSADMKARIEEELANNPALDEAGSIEQPTLQDEDPQEEASITTDYDTSGEEYRGLHVRSNSSSNDWQDISQAKLSVERSLEEYLLEQLSFLQLDEKQHKIGVHLIGSVEGDGYIRRDLEAIVNDLATTQYLEANIYEVADILEKIQHFDPPGIGARNLQECLLIQLEKQNIDSEARTLAVRILKRCFEFFIRRQYRRIANKLGIKNTEILKDAFTLIARLNPRPGDKSEGIANNEILYPDFVVTKQDGELQVTLNNYHLPTLRVRKNYVAMLEGYHRQKTKTKQLREAAVFVRKKLEAAQWFIDAIRQRQQTLMHTMRAIVELQHDFFMEEEESKLKPMGMKYVASQIGMDVSTISRVVSNKSVQTDSGIYPLKFFFTEAISTTSGEEVSNREVKKSIEDIISSEDKRKPYSDAKLAVILKEKGYNIARRTVAKYREFLNLPVARLRREL